MAESNSSADDSQVFIDQARWMLEWHNRRSEGFMTRAVSLLGFSGVVLALLVQGAEIDGITASRWTWIFLGGLLIALFASGVCSVMTIAPETVLIPSVSQLRDQWRRHAAAPQAGTTASQVAESLLYSKALTEESAVSSAKGNADKRGKRFKMAVVSILGAYMFFVLLVCNILAQAWGK